MKIKHIVYNDMKIAYNADRLKFIDGLAIVTIEKNDLVGGCYSLSGIVDSNFRTILPLSGDNDLITIFPKGNYIFRKRTTDKSINAFELFHYKILNGNKHFVNSIKSAGYLRINDRVIKNYNNLNDTYFEALYDAVLGTYISDKFTGIGTFEKDGDEMLALSWINLTDNRHINNIQCYINTSGKIVSPLYSDNLGRNFKTDYKDFNLYENVKYIKEKIDYSKQEKEGKLITLELRQNQKM